MRTVLTVSTSDSSCGAGIQGDLKALQAHGTYGASVIVSILAENTVSVRSVMPIPVDHVTSQFDAVCEDMLIDAVKIGALPTASHVTCVVHAIRRFGLTNIVMDPTLFSTGGDALADASTMGAVRREMLPLVHCLCPNRLELGQLFATEPLLDDDDAIAAARCLLREGAHNIVITGGYGDGAEANDILVTASDITVFPAARSRARSIHGTGCALTSVIAAGLAHGHDLKASIAEAKSYVTAAIRAGGDLRIGQGAGPIDHNVHLPQSLSAFRSQESPARAAPLDAF